MNRLKTVIAALLVMIMFTGCGLNGKNDIIKVDNKIITQKDFNKSFDLISGGMLKTLGIDAKKDPDNVMVLMAKEQVISQLVINTLVNNAIEQNKITVSKAELEAAEKEISGKFATKEQFLQILKANGASYEDFKRNLEQEIKVKKYVDSIAMVSIGEQEALKYYKANPDKFKYPRQVRASHILIAANADLIKDKLKKENKDMKDEAINLEVKKQMAEAKKKAQDLQLKAKKAPSTFAALAKENSQDTLSAIKGGDLGFFTKEEMVEEFAKAAFSLKPNTISQVIQTPYGYHIIMVTDRKEAGKYTFDQTKKEIIALLENQDKMSIFKNKIAELGKNAKIEYLNDDYNPEILQKKIKEASKDNPDLKKIINGAAGAKAQKTEQAKEQPKTNTKIQTKAKTKG